MNLPTVKIETHGCKLNMADSQRLARAFFQAGFEVESGALSDRVDRPNDRNVDVYVLNSCTVTHVADRKARRALSAARRAHPGALIVASGCFAERSPAAAEALDAVDLVVTNRDKPRLVERVAARMGIRAPASPASPASQASVISPFLGRTRAFIRIQEGCDQVCAYCIVPRVRGRERSVPADELVAQVGTACEEGVKEIVLTGTQLGTYGFDLPAAGPTQGPIDLRRLLQRLLRETAVARIRVSSLQPAEMGDELLELWPGEGRGRLCPHFHMPLQSGSDPVLARMRRRYTAREYLNAAARARRAAPMAAITADVIAGFPGESDRDFQATADMLRDANLAGAHVFPYSPRPGTSAARFPDHIPPRVRAERAAQLRDIANGSAREYRASLVGQTRAVLWETPTTSAASATSGPVLSGLADNYVRVKIEPGASRLLGRVNRIEAVQFIAVEGDHMVGHPPDLPAFSADAKRGRYLDAPFSR